MNWFSLLTTTNIVFIIAMILILILFWFKYKSIIGLKKIAPIFIGIGVFGTFWGIFMALQSFNSDIATLQNSISDLLNGLKTAFLTSIIGMLISLSLNIIATWKIQAELAGDDTNQFESYLQMFNEFAQNQKEATQNTNRMLEKIAQALIGDGEATIITQLQKMRTQMQDGMDNIYLKLDENKMEFRNFAQTMAENNHNALIAALREVILDFNSKISEQFGDNFKELNIAVGKLLEWQVGYKSSIEIIEQTLQTTIQGIVIVNDKFTTIVKNSQSFSTVADKLDDILNGLDSQVSSVSALLNEFNNIGSDAKNAFDLVDGKINQMINTMKKSFDEQIDIVKNLSSDNKEISENMRVLLSDSVVSFEKNFNIIQKSLEETVKDFLESNIKSMEDFTHGNQQRILKQLEDFDNQLGDELTKALNSLASQLTSISSQFVTDYQTILEHYRKLLLSPNGVQHETNGYVSPRS